MKNIFGREPALVASVIEGAVLAATTFGLGWSAEQIVEVNAVVSLVLAFYVAYGVYDVAAGVLLQLLKAGLVLLAGFGVSVGPDRTAALVGLATAFIALFSRTQLTAVQPALTPVRVDDAGVSVTEVAMLVIAAAFAIFVAVYVFGRP